jgi:hypothetical protein
MSHRSLDEGGLLCRTILELFIFDIIWTMNYKGVIIEESLQDASVIKELKVLETKIEPITPEHKTPWLKQWTLHTVEIPEEKAEEVAEKISKSFDKGHLDWYADYKNNKYHFIIYAGKVFRVDLANPVLYKDAKKYGISIGIPEYQVDFVPEDKVWER